MTKFVLRRLGFLVLTVFFTSIIIFTVTQFLPGDVARVILGREASDTAVEVLRQELRLNRPVWEQYLSWLGGFVTGDWGASYSTSQPIRPLVFERLGNSLRLAGLTLLIAVPLAIVLGVVAVLNEESFVDNAISVGSLSVVGLPEFVTGIVLIQIFAFWLGWLPANCRFDRGPASSRPSRRSFCLP